MVCFDFSCVHRPVPVIFALGRDRKQNYANSTGFLDYIIYGFGSHNAYARSPKDIPEGDSFFYCWWQGVGDYFSFCNAMPERLNLLGLDALFYLSQSYTVRYTQTASSTPILIPICLVIELALTRPVAKTNNNMKLPQKRRYFRKEFGSQLFVSSIWDSKYLNFVFFPEFFIFHKYPTVDLRHTEDTTFSFFSVFICFQLSSHN